MLQKYSGPDAAGVDTIFSASDVRGLLDRLLPRADSALLLDALLAEAAGAANPLPMQLDAEASPPVRELARVQRLHLAGEVAPLTVHHAMSNTLTALQTEAQLLELEPLADEHRRASSRIVELSRRLATVMRRLDPSGTPPRMG